MRAGLECEKGYSPAAAQSAPDTASVAQWVSAQEPQ
jgi:hypothetical protein